VAGSRTRNHADLAAGRQQLRTTVGLLIPHNHPSIALLPYVRFVKHVRAGVLAASQFAPTLRDAEGEFAKPDG
jgi:hypothetical protein